MYRAVSWKPWIEVGGFSMVADLRSDTMAPAWWARAKQDFQAAGELAENGSSAPWIVAYHAQQAAEKFIKAYLVAHGLSSDTSGFRTHEIDDLRDLVSEYDAGLAQTLAIADKLSDYAVESRYPPPSPDAEETITEDEAEEAVRIAHQAGRLIQRELRPILSKDLLLPPPREGPGRSR